jgi:LacI family transcriptional regulator
VAGARLAVEHLLSLGHETVWHVSGPRDWLEARDRVDGWRQVLEGAGRRVPPVVRGDWSPRSGYEAGRHLAGQPDVTAVFCANDQQALGMLRALHELGVRVPEDVSVVGFDDIPEAEYLSPPLTTVRQDFDEVGRRCLAALLDMLDARDSAPSRDSGAAGVSADAGWPSVPAGQPRVPPTLVVRASTAAPGGGRPDG